MSTITSPEGNDLAGACLWCRESRTEDLVPGARPAATCIRVAAAIRDGRLRARRTLSDPAGYLCRPRPTFRRGRFAAALFRAARDTRRNAGQHPKARRVKRSEV